MNQGSELLGADAWLAKRLLARGLKIEPTEATAWFNLGIGLHQQRRIDAAIRAYRHCLKLPHSKETEQAARNNLAQDLLLLGRWDEGWNHYRQRFARKPGNHPLFVKNFGPSHKGSITKERPVLLMSEQGFGDTLQFSRYAMYLQREGYDVTLLSQPALVPLLRDAVGIKQVKSQITKLEWEGRKPLWLPLLDLFTVLRAHEQWSLFRTSYLKIKKEQIHKWGAILKRNPKKRLIALHWQGNPEHEHSLYSRGRSIPFKKLKALSQLKNVEFVSIQKGAGSEQLTKDSGLKFVNGQEYVNHSMDFKETAAVLANCDLLISSDSAVAHLAGAMGIETWLALRWIPEWRWGLEGSKTCWYESVRLFRQPRDGCWENVIEDMIRAWRGEYENRSNYSPVNLVL